MNFDIVEKIELVEKKMRKFKFDEDKINEMKDRFEKYSEIIIDELK